MFNNIIFKANKKMFIIFFSIYKYQITIIKITKKNSEKKHVRKDIKIFLKKKNTKGKKNAGGRYQDLSE